MVKKKTKKVPLEFKADDLNKFNFKYYVDYDYDTSYSCEINCVNDYCRCGVISNIKITHAPNINSVIHKLFERKVKDPILIYCIDRLLRLNGLDKPDNYSGNAVGGYYGEEMGSVDFDHMGAVVVKIDNLLSKKTNTERIEFVLLEEYGHLLPKMKGLTYHFKEVGIADVQSPNNNYLMKINKDKVSMYEKELNYEIPVCVCIKNGHFYDLIDGYHRLTAAKNAGKKKIIILSVE